MLKKLIFLSLVLLGSPALADIPIAACGAPSPAELKTDPGGTYCDIYSRQLAYAQEDVKFRELLKKRQANFAAPSLKASADYRQKVKELHGFAKEPAPDSESFGPGLNP